MIEFIVASGEKENLRAAWDPSLGSGDKKDEGGNPVSAAQKAEELGQISRQQGAVSAERARVVQEFRERQRQAMINKVSM